jgi:anti-sigma-K factor RskA
MSDRDRTADRRECGGDVAAYALGALDATEAEAFRRHLETCSVCQEELSSFQEVVNELPLTAPQQKAPAAIRRNVMRDVRADARMRRAGGATPRRGRVWFARGLGSLIPRPVLALGVAAAVAIAVVVGVTSGSSGGRVIAAQVVGQGTAQMRISGGRASLVVHHFAQPPAGKIYEVWLVHGKQPPKSAMQLFSVTSAGNAVVDVPGGVKGLSSVLVTPEPMGGSPHPTHAPVISVSLD